MELYSKESTVKLFINQYLKLKFKKIDTNHSEALVLKVCKI